MHSFWLLTRAWLRGIVRDRATIFWMFAFPILFVVIFGLAFGGNDSASYKVGVAVDDSTLTGQALVNALRGVKPFNVTTGTADAELKKLKDGDRYAVVTMEPAPSASALPAAGTTRRFVVTPTLGGVDTALLVGPSSLSGASRAAAQASTVVVYYDPSRSAAAQIVRPIVRQVVDGVDRQLAGTTPILTVDERSVRSNELRYIDFFLPGVIGFSIMQAGMFSAIPLVQLRVQRVLKRFGATPVSRWAVLSSQGLARLMLAFMQTVVLIAVGWLLFKVHAGHNPAGVVVFLILGGLVFLGAGFALSGLARTEESVPALVQVFSFPMMFLSGVFFPVENFPSFVQPLSRALPLTFLGDGLRQTMVGGAALNPLWVDMAALAVWAVVTLALSVRLFRWE